MYKLFQHMIHDVHVINHFNIPIYIDNILNKINNGDKYFENLVYKYLIKNKHVLKLSMIPKKDYFEIK